MTDDEKAVIVGVLCSQALADHLGDVRDAERDLWKLLGLDPSGGDDDPFTNTQKTLKRAGIPLPTYLGTHELVEQERLDESDFDD